VIMNNQIFQAPFNFNLLSSNFKNWAYKDVNEGDSLIILKELDLTKVSATARTAGAFTAAEAAAAAVLEAVDADRAAYWKIYDQAKEEFIKTGKINGFEILNLRSMDRLWISHYDMDFLVKYGN